VNRFEVKIFARFSEGRVSNERGAWPSSIACLFKLVEGSMQEPCNSDLMKY
jgi:hypothetical protein